MRAYKFLNEYYGLKSLCERRLRRTRLNELNDPFELRPYDLRNPALREAFEGNLIEMEKRFTLLCFSKNWSNPLIWAHYSDKHKGLCLGFETPPEVAKAQTRAVTYIPAALTFPRDIFTLDEAKQQTVAEEMIFTKFVDWQYEREIRTWLDREEEFFDFCQQLQLVEVIIGTKSGLLTRAVTNALGSQVDQVKVKMARAADDEFKIVEA